MRVSAVRDEEILLIMILISAIDWLHGHWEVYGTTMTEAVWINANSPTTLLDYLAHYGQSETNPLVIHTRGSVQLAEARK